MSNILNVSNSIPGYENNIKNNPYTTVDANIPNQVDPSKVVRPDGRTDTGQEQNNRMGLNYESNYDNFMQMVNTSPKLTQIFTQLIFSGMSNLVEAGIGETFAKEIAGFFEQMKMSEEEAIVFIKNQMNGAVRFKGALFNLLRQVMNETTSVDLKAGILDFVKRYGDMAASKHLLDNIASNIEEIKQYMFKADREILETMFARMNMDDSQNYTKENLQILKNEILPFLSKYISKTHDMGKIRNVISLLAFNIARYENGSLESLSQSFKRLMNFQAFRGHFKGVNGDELIEVLANADFDQEAGKNNWADSFLNIMRLGVKGEAGLENKQLFENIMNAILLNESVYMPILHLMLPIELNGNLMFSEIWVDPDAEGSNAGESQERKIKLLVKFDIKHVGFFDLILLYSDGKADVQLYYPKKLAPLEKEIEKGMTTIMSKNHIEAQTLLVDQNKSSKALSDIFPKIHERKNVINVSV
jgi:hypothetical protein